MLLFPKTVFLLMHGNYQKNEVLQTLKVSSHSLNELQSVLFQESQARELVIIEEPKGEITSKRGKRVRMRDWVMMVVFALYCMDPTVDLGTKLFELKATTTIKDG